MHKYVLLIMVALSPLVLAGPLPDKPHVYVEGSAEIKVPPDRMTVVVGLEATRPSLAEAKQLVDERSRRLIQAVKALGIAQEDLSTTELHISPAYDWRDGQQVPLGTRVYRQVDITLRDLSKYGDLVAALVDAEISNTVSTRLEVSNEKALSDRALTAAIEDARQRAESMARATGRELGGAYSISQFDLRRDDRQPLFTVSGLDRLQRAQPESAMAGDASEPFEPGLIVTRAQVYVVFLVR